jgi:hypothetical protein
MSNGTAVVAVTFDEMSRLAEAIAQSGLFGFKTASQALALMAIAQAEGQHPALAARDYHIVQGRPVLKSDAMLARFQAAGGKVEWIEMSDERAEATFSHPQGGKVTLSWDTERARRAGLAGKDNYKHYARQMLRARVVSEGIRTVFPGAVVGMLSPEEAADIAPEAPERDVTPKPLTGVAAIAAKVAEKTPAAENQSVTIDPASGEMFDDAPLPYADVAAEIQTAIEAKDTDALIAAVALLPRVANEQHRAELDVLARAGWKAIKAKAA